jgi:hypothetical protein
MFSRCQEVEGGTVVTIYLYWWYIPIVLFVLPFIYGWRREPSGDWDLGIDLMLVAVLCWAGAIGIVIGKLA